MDKGWTKHGQRMDTNGHEPTQKDTNGCKWTQSNTMNKIKSKRTATDNNELASNNINRRSETL